MHPLGCTLSFQHSNCTILQTVLPTLRFTHQIGLLWNRLSSVGQVTLNWTIFHLYDCSSFFLEILQVSCQFRKFLNLFNSQEHFFFPSISGIRTSWRAINIDISTSHGKQKSFFFFVLFCFVFWPNWVILIILLLKSTQIWEIGSMITW